MNVSDPLLHAIPPALWPALARASHRLLMLDYDGTLVPLRVERALARPSPERLARLGRLARSPRDTLAIVSGRPLADLERFVGDLPVWLVGEHGWDSRDPAGRRTSAPLDETARAGLEAAMRATIAAGWGARLERKRTALVLHTRDLGESDATRLAGAIGGLWQPPASIAPLRLDRIDGGFELRALGHDKGEAARTRMAAAPPGTLPVFVGDDLTDEDAFAAVRGSGFAIRVADDIGSSLATGRIPSWESVDAFLDAWIRHGGVP